MVTSLSSTPYHSLEGKMAHVKRSIDLVIFGGGGFIGSAILREAAKRSLSSIPVGRNVSTTKLSCDKVHVGNALDPTTYEDLLENARCVVVTIGSPPLPWPLNPLSKEDIVKYNGDCCRVPIEVAASKGVENIILINASMPKMMSFLVPGYYEGKMMGRKTCKKIAEEYPHINVSVLKPGVVHTNERFDRAPTFIFGAFGKLLNSSFGQTLTKVLNNILPFVFKGLLVPPVEVNDLAAEVVDSYTRTLHDDKKSI